MPFAGKGKKGEIQFYNMYPVTILCDRFNGTYSGGLFTVWGCHPEHIPEKVYSDDDACRDFWKYEIDNFKYQYGIGGTIQEAVDDLYYKLENPDIEVKQDFWWKKKQLLSIIEDDRDIINELFTITTDEANEALAQYDRNKEEFLKHKESRDDS